MSLAANQRKLDAAEQLAELAEEAGMSLIEMAIAFVLRHPAVTSAIIGPRTMEHLESQLAAADVELSDDVLDRIDEIVPPGMTINPADNGGSARPWTPQPAAASPPAVASPPAAASSPRRRWLPAPSAPQTGQSSPQIVRVVV